MGSKFERINRSIYAAWGCHAACVWGEQIQEQAAGVLFKVCTPKNDQICIPIISLPKFLLGLVGN